MKKIRKFSLTNQKESVELRRTLIKQKKEPKL